MSYVIAGYTLTLGSIGVYALWVVRRVRQVSRDR